MARYPDYGSPVRKAWQKARAELPCSTCGSDREPALRTPRPYGARWLEDPRAYIGCAGCGRPLATLEGSAAARPSDVSVDRLPDPAGLVRQRCLPALERVDGETLPRALARVAREVAADHGLGTREVPTPPAGDPDVPAIHLTWQGRPWMALVVWPSSVTEDQIRRFEEPVLATSGLEALARIGFADSPGGNRVVASVLSRSGGVWKPAA